MRQHAVGVCLCMYLHGDKPRIVRALSDLHGRIWDVAAVDLWQSGEVCNVALPNVVDETKLHIWAFNSCDKCLWCCTS